MVKRIKFIERIDRTGTTPEAAVQSTKKTILRSPTSESAFTKAPLRKVPLRKVL